MEGTFIDKFMAFMDPMEPPATFNRWCGIVATGVMLERNFYFQHGHMRINPNHYVMFLGESGTRKSTPIKIIKKLLVDTGFRGIAASKTSKEKYLSDLANLVNTSDGIDDYLDRDSSIDDPAVSLIAADEWNDFMGLNDMLFVSLLGSLWDFEGTYENRIKGGKCDLINNPTISILAGNTATGFQLAFPPEALGQGFFSRTLLIHGVDSGKCITFPDEPLEEDRLWLVMRLLEMSKNIRGRATVSPEAKKLMDAIYISKPSIDDVRFTSFSSRRLTHLIKLCLVMAANRMSMEISESDVVQANTILRTAEMSMPFALGEFGKSKNSPVVQKIMVALDSARKPLGVRELWSLLHADLEDMQGLQKLINNLLEAGRVQVVHDRLSGDPLGILPKRSPRKISAELGVDLSFLTPEEKRFVS